MASFNSSWYVFAFLLLGIEIILVPSGVHSESPVGQHEWEKRNGMTSSLAQAPLRYLPNEQVSNRGILAQILQGKGLPAGQYTGRQLPEQPNAQQDLPTGQQQELPNAQQQFLPNGQQQELPNAQQQPLPNGPQQDLPTRQQQDPPNSPQQDPLNWQQQLPPNWQQQLPPNWPQQDPANWPLLGQPSPNGPQQDLPTRQQQDPPNSPQQDPANWQQQDPANWPLLGQPSPNGQVVYPYGGQLPLQMQPTVQNQMHHINMLVNDLQPLSKKVEKIKMLLLRHNIWPDQLIIKDPSTKPIVDEFFVLRDKVRCNGECAYSIAKYRLAPLFQSHLHISAENMLMFYLTTLQNCYLEMHKAYTRMILLLENLLRHLNIFRA